MILAISATTCCYWLLLLLLLQAMRCLAVSPCAACLLACCTRARVSCLARCPASFGGFKFGLSPLSRSPCSPSERPQRGCKTVLRTARTRRRALRSASRCRSIMLKRPGLRQALTAAPAWQKNGATWNGWNSDSCVHKYFSSSYTSQTLHVVPCRMCHIELCPLCEFGSSSRFLLCPVRALDLVPRL